MIHKLGNICDVAKLKHINVSVKEALLDYTSVLTNFYGEDRDIDNDDGGYVLYCEKSTLPEDIKAFFDYSENVLECASDITNTDYFSATYILNNEFAVILVMHSDDIPDEIRKEL